MDGPSTPTRPAPPMGGLGTANRKSPSSVNGPPSKPGNPTDPSSFFSAHEKEARVAAYCGFTDTGEFKRFAMSAYVIPHYLDFLSLRKSSSLTLSRRIALELLNDCPTTDFASERQASVAWPVKNDDKSSKDMQLAGIAMQMLRGLTPESASQELADLSHAQLCADTGKRFPMVDMSKVKCPDFGPHGTESVLEPANRCLSVLYYLGFATNTSNFEKKFDHTAWDQTKSITEAYKPGWMQSSKKGFSAKKLLPDEPFPAGRNVAEPPLTVDVKWNYDSRAPEASAYRDYVEEEGLDGQLPKLKTTVEVHHHLNGAQFRDLIRVAFDMSNVHAQLSTCKLVVTRPSDSIGKEIDSGDEEATQFETLRFNILTDDWQEVQKVLRGPTTTVLFTITTKELGSGVLLEWAAPPKNLMMILRQHNGDVATFQRVDGQDAADGQEEESHENDNQMDKIVGSMGHSKKAFDPLALFEGDEERMLRFYGGHDVTSPDGIRAFQEEAFSSSKIIGYQPPVDMDGSSRRFGKSKGLPSALLQTLESGREENFAASMNQDPEARSGRLSDELKYYALQQAMVGTAQQVGPPINPSVRALEMVREDDGSGKEAYRFTRMEGTNRKLYPYQVNGVVWLLTRWLGSIPMRPNAPQEVIDIAAKLKSVRTGSGFMGDQTGSGKTILLLAALIVGKDHVLTDANGRRMYKMKFLAVPATLIPQWAKEIIDHWPGFNLVISYDETGMPARLQKYFLTGTAVRQYPNSRRWPKAYEYLLDPYDPKTGTTIFLTTYETHGNRTLTYENKDKENERFRSNFEGAFDIVAADESQKMKDDETRRWKCVFALKGILHVLVTATAMLNRSTDILAQARILYISTERIIREDPKAHHWILDHRGAVSFYEDAKKFGPDDKRLLGCIDPSNLAALLTCDSATQIAEFFPMAENLFALKRSNASRIPREFEDGEYFEMKEIVKPHLLATRICRHRADEEVEFQYLYRESCKRYIAVTRGSAKNNKQKALFGKGKQAGNYGSGEMRELLIVTASTKMAIFNHLAKAMDRDTLVDTIQGQDDRGWTAFDLVDFICIGTAQPKPTTAIGYIEFLTHGSPMLRAIYFHIYNGGKYMGTEAKKKLLITEDIPLLARFYELALNLVFVTTKCFHSGLDAAGRLKLQDDFNNPESALHVMPLAYDVGGYGISLQMACDEVVVATPAKNHGSEIQAYGRPIRADQKNIVTVTKLTVPNSIHGYRESRKRDKVLTEYATRASDPRLREAMVQLLNEAQEEIRTAQAAEENQELRAQILHEANVTKDLRRFANDEGIVRDTIDIGKNKILEGPRKRNRPNRFAELKWTNGGKLATEASPNPAKKKGKKTEPVSDSRKSARKQSRQASTVEAEENVDEEREIDDDYIDDVEEDSGESTSEGEDQDDKDFVPDGTTPSKNYMRKQARALFLSEDQLGEEERYLTSLLTLDGSKIYTLTDLNDEDTLIRGLGLLYARRMGQKASKVPSIHIKYTHLGGGLASSVQNILKFKESALGVLTEIFDGVKNAARLAIDEPSRPEPAEDELSDSPPSIPADENEEEHLQDTTQSKKATKALSGASKTNEKKRTTTTGKARTSGVSKRPTNSNDSHKGFTVKKLKEKYGRLGLPKPMPKNKLPLIQAIETFEAEQSVKERNAAEDHGEDEPTDAQRELDEELWLLATGPESEGPPAKRPRVSDENQEDHAPESLSGE